jgi:hypothetical protein
MKPVKSGYLPAFQVFLFILPILTDRNSVKITSEEGFEL